MDSLGDIFSRKDYDEPPESRAVRQYVQDQFKTDVSVKVRERDIIVSVPNASLATTLRLRASEIKRRCQIDKRLVFRII